MSLLNDIIKEMASAGSTGAHAIAGSRGSLFGGGVIDLKKERKRQTKMMRRIMGYKVIGEGLEVNNSETQFDGSDAISKIDAAEKKSRANKDTVVFGMEDEDGGLVKVYVKSDQADDFEQTLAAMLSGEDDNEDEENTAMEIAEVLFKLKDKFEIVDVEWPTIEGDEEEEQEVEDDLNIDDTKNTDGADDEMNTDDSNSENSMDSEDNTTADNEMDNEEDAKSALQQVIDVMKADADAKKAEAEAKEAEAKAKEAEYVAQASAAKVKQEEEVLDMETYYKEKSEKEKEAKRLAKLAKYKHDTATDAETSLSMESEESSEDGDPWKKNDNDTEDDQEITTKELATLILKNLRAN